MHYSKNWVRMYDDLSSSIISLRSTMGCYDLMHMESVLSVIGSLEMISLGDCSLLIWVHIRDSMLYAKFLKGIENLKYFMRGYWYSILWLDDGLHAPLQFPIYLLNSRRICAQEFWYLHIAIRNKAWSALFQLIYSVNTA